MFAGFPGPPVSGDARARVGASDGKRNQEILTSKICTSAAQ